MIDELHIRGLGVIEDATLRLAPGLTVITGETGAGKTMVVSALGLLLGDRADTSLVRVGSDRALVEARLRPVPPSAGDWVEADEDELVVSRELPADGRSRARVNGRLAPASALAEVLGSVVEVHAQHEHVRLARADVQRSLLDRYAGEPHGRALAAYRATYAAWRDASGALHDLEEASRERARTIDRLRFEADEIAAAGLDVDRDRRLDDDVAVLEHAEELQLLLAEAATALGSDGAGEPLGVAVGALRRAPVADEVLTALRERAVGLAAETTELAADVRAYAETVEADPERLDELRARQQLIANLRRKYGPDIDDVVVYGDRAASQLASLQGAEADAAELGTRVAELAAELGRLAADVTRGRRLGAERLSAAVDGHLADLAMPHARFTVDVAPLEDGSFRPDGVDRVTFLLAANPGEPARPLATAASGGERSRVALAVEVALADVDDAAVLVFDEVDAGIGGATALAVGEKLARLAAGGGRQVVCVTHLAQLAAFADVHHVVEKGIRGGRTVTTSRAVTDDERPAELARMLGGDAAREAGVEHARELLAEAGRRRAG